METAHTLSMAILRQRKKEKIPLKKKFSYSKETFYKDKNVIQFGSYKGHVHICT